MANRNAVLLFIEDQPVLASLKFYLAIEGLQALDGTADGIDPSVAATMVIDENYLGDGLAVLRDLPMQDCKVPAIVLATNPNTGLRNRLNALGAELIEKPLLGDELSHAIHALIETRKVA